MAMGDSHWVGVWWVLRGWGSLLTLHPSCALITEPSHYQGPDTLGVQSSATRVAVCDSLTGCQTWSERPPFCTETSPVGLPVLPATGQSAQSSCSRTALSMKADVQGAQPAKLRATSSKYRQRRVLVGVGVTLRNVSARPLAC